MNRRINFFFLTISSKNWVAREESIERKIVVFQRQRIVEISRGEPRNVSLADVEVSELALKFFQRLESSASLSASSYGL